MPELGDFSDRVGTSAHAIQIPHARPDTPDQHARNWREVQQRLNSLPMNTTWVYQNRTALTIPGDNTATDLATLKLMSSEMVAEVWLQVTASTGTIGDYSLTFTPAPTASHALNVDQSVTGIGTTQLEVYAPGWQRYDRVSQVTLSLAVDMSDDSSVDVLWCLQVRPAKLYLF